MKERARTKEPESTKFKVLDENSENLDNWGTEFSFRTEIRKWECDALMGWIEGE